jgi:methylamine dehydrogenase accessory protein MauD
VDDALIVSNVLLWIAVVCLVGVVLALLRQVGILHERIAPAGALVGSEGPRVGEEAPVQSVEDWSGRRLRIGGANADGRATLLFFVSPTCPVCKTLLPQAGAVCAAEDRRARLVVASDGPREEHAAFVRAHALDRGDYVLSAELGLAFQVGRLPYAVLIDGDGVVCARGLVNTREHLESLFEARAQGVASVQEYMKHGEERQRVA